jgi:hypothetical protein
MRHEERANCKVLDNSDRDQDDTHNHEAKREVSAHTLTSPENSDGKRCQFACAPTIAGEALLDNSPT